jgi:hypothetical protein
MRAFGFAVVTAVILGIGFWLVLSSVQQSSAEKFTTSSVRN